MIRLGLTTCQAMPRRTRPENLTKTEFCRTCAKFPTGVTIVTVMDAEGSPHGMTASSFTSVSLDPPLVLVCVDHRATVLAHLRRAQHIGFNVLSEDQQPLSDHFARRGHDRFDRVEWYAGRSGVPLIPGAIASFECSIQRMVDAGDHTIFIAKVEYVEHSDGRPLVYFASGYRKLDGEAE
jgi:flavin reductase (DIM6/NTAB) family NADH-FMN oxidoreductase RutF